MKAFKAYDIRGIYNKDFDQEDVYKIGFFLPQLLEADEILVGYDDRVSTPEIFDALCQGISDKGADVINIGYATTPMVYFATARYDYKASVMITASHNPPEYNGLKISREKALPVGYESGLDKLEKLIDTDEITPTHIFGGVYEKDVQEEYIEFLESYLPDLSNLSLAVDCSNGMAGLLIKDVLGDRPIYINEEMDGSFPNHTSNPLLAKNRESLKKTVLENDCDLGIIFDGDGDRVMFLDEKGQFISPDLMVAVLAGYYLKDNPGENVLFDIRTSWSVKEYIEKMGGNPIMWKVGHAFAKRKMREIDCICGGELAGHYYFRDFHYCDSGMLACLIVLNEVVKLKEKEINFSKMIEGLNNYSFSGEINFEIGDKIEAMQELTEYMQAKEEPEEIYDFDGYRIEFSDWWFNVRPSNTEPYLRLVVEARNDGLLQEKVEEIKGFFTDKYSLTENNIED
jgi:phosphomannomutase